jgi:hypothetical protein
MDRLLLLIIKCCRFEKTLALFVIIIQKAVFTYRINPLINRKSELRSRIPALRSRIPALIR